MDKLYSDDPVVREAEAARYHIFHKKVNIPTKWRRYWKELLDGRDLESGHDWPEQLLGLLKTRKWPEYTFGTANASCLVVLHRPGDASVNKVSGDTFISPDLPVLGGIPHAHNALWYPKCSKSQTWRSLHCYLVPAFARLNHPWSQVMTTNLTTTPARTGITDSQANLRTVNSRLLDFIINLCQPRLILLCGNPVQKATANWSPPPRIEVIECKHPSRGLWDRDGGMEGRRIRDTIKKVLFS